MGIAVQKKMESVNPAPATQDRIDGKGASGVTDRCSLTNYKSENLLLAGKGAAVAGVAAAALSLLPFPPAAG